MKTSTFLLTALLGVAPALGLTAAPEASVKPRAEVAFFEPQNFTDVKDSSTGDYQRTTYLDQIRDHVLQQAKYYIPAGQTLQVTFTDIDMAGDFEPWRGPQFSDVRIVRDTYPPKIALAFRLTDAEGNVLKEGKRQLSDLAFLMKIKLGSREDPVRHEKALLDDWLSSEFPRAKKE